MAQNHKARVPAWQGCQLQRAKQALAERRRRLREASRRAIAETGALPELGSSQ